MWRHQERTVKRHILRFARVVCTLLDKMFYYMCVYVSKIFSLSRNIVLYHRFKMRIIVKYKFNYEYCL